MKREDGAGFFARLGGSFLHNLPFLAGAALCFALGKWLYAPLLPVALCLAVAYGLGVIAETVFSSAALTGRFAEKEAPSISEPKPNEGNDHDRTNL